MNLCRRPNRANKINKLKPPSPSPSPYGRKAVWPAGGGSGVGPKPPTVDSQTRCHWGATNGRKRGPVSQPESRFCGSFFAI
ncbi:unnamed protein product [Soboliphyme baturini]|uniref:Uncharacterized protein n=1 Tax=Soboliphyme baturini TaxID=241478 RepID=A0A183I9V1_9BILA|nr:unnamed protein product [Soboliphyme baturini]